MKYSSYNRIKKYLYKKIFTLLYSSNFKYYGSKVSIIFPDTMNGEEFISLHSNVVIEKGSWLLAHKQDDVIPELTIFEGVNIGRYSHIVALQRVVIEKNVLIADKVYISDNIHQYTDIILPIKNQRIEFKKEVYIGKNSWIGENVSIIGASIGKHCVVGSNSVVTNDIMDYSVVAGIPAKYIKRYDLQTKKWKKTNDKGEFLNEI